jgi:CheY-like chemotaxis protein
MARKKILIVDDEPDLLKVTVFRLRQSGYEVISASDGQQGWEKVCNEKPDLVCLDIRMPLMTGDQVCAKIKSEDSLRHIPVLLLTASTQNMQEKIDLCRADGYLSKPFDSQVLLETIRGLIKGPE